MARQEGCNRAICCGEDPCRVVEARPRDHATTGRALRHAIEAAQPVTADPVERLKAMAHELGADSDEVRVLLVIAERALMGKRCYGALNVASDPRCMRREAFAEFIDGLFYLAAATMQPPPR